MTDLFSYLKQEQEEKAKGRKEKAEKVTEAVKEELFSVVEITRKIKGLLEPSFSKIWVEGEVSNFKKHSSGHNYFSLKDDKAVISCVMWRSTAERISFRPENGQKVKVFGNITVYEGRGNYQIDVKKIVISGIGELQAEFERLKKQLNEEGIFDPAHKKKLPELVRNVGVITAETGAAFQDIRKVIRSRAPFINIYIHNARVQGKGTEKELVEALEFFNQCPEPIDVIIIGRGGGSLEDLWSFNEEIVARAIYRSEIPVISAVGHEIDFSISDFVADIRAATPSHAAEIVSINAKEELQTLDYTSVRLNNLITSYLTYQKERLNGIENSHAFKRPSDVLKNYSMIIDNIEEKFELVLNMRLDTEKSRLENYGNILRNLDPSNVLNRGYALVRDKGTSAIVSTAKSAKEKSEVEIQFKDGSIDAVVKK